MLEIMAAFNMYAKIAREWLRMNGIIVIKNGRRQPGADGLKIIENSIARITGLGKSAIPNTENIGSNGKNNIERHTALSLLPMQKNGNAPMLKNKDHR